MLRSPGCTVLLVQEAEGRQEETGQRLKHGVEFSPIEHTFLKALHCLRVEIDKPLLGQKIHFESTCSP